MDSVIFIVGYFLLILAQDTDGQLHLNESANTRVHYPFKYSVGIGGKLNMKIAVTNKPVDVSDGLLVYHHGSQSMLTLLLSLVNKTGTVVDITHSLSDLLWLDIMLRNNTEICAVKTIVRADLELSEEKIASANHHTNNASLVCASEKACSIEVDLGNKCEESGVDYVAHDFGFDWNSTIDMTVTVINMPARASGVIAQLAIGSGNLQDSVFAVWSPSSRVLQTLLLRVPIVKSGLLSSDEEFSSVTQKLIVRWDHFAAVIGTSPNKKGIVRIGYLASEISNWGFAHLKYEEFVVPAIVFNNIRLRTSTQIVVFLHDSENQLCSVKTVFNVREPVINILRGDQYTYNCSVSKRHCDVTVDFENKCDAQKKDEDRRTTKLSNNLPAATTPTSVTFANTTEVNNTSVEVGFSGAGNFILSAALVAVAVVGNCVLAIIIVVIVRRKKAKQPRPAEPLPKVEFSPFYLNMLFREQCQREIEAEEDAHYEQIDEEAYYEQID